MEFTSVSFFICATDEENSLKKTVRDVLDLCRDNMPEKIVIVMSRDATEGCRRAAEECRAAAPDLIECMFQHDPGLRGAILNSVDHITSSHTIGLSADYPISIDNIPAMIEGAKKEPDVIFKNSRHLQKHSFSGYSKTKMLFNVCGQAFLRFLFRSKLTDLTSPLQIMPTQLYKDIKWTESSFAFLEEMVLIPLRLGIRIVELPAKCMSRTEGTSKNSFFQTAKYLTAALRIRFTPKKNLLKNKDNVF